MNKPRANCHDLFSDYFNFDKTISVNKLSVGEFFLSPKNSDAVFLITGKNKTHVQYSPIYFSEADYDLDKDFMVYEEIK